MNIYLHDIEKLEPHLTKSNINIHIQYRPQHSTKTQEVLLRHELKHNLRKQVDELVFHKQAERSYMKNPKANINLLKAVSQDIAKIKADIARTRGLLLHFEMQRPARNVARDTLLMIRDQLEVQHNATTA